ncbi:hypothetical protein NA57DRAFT_52784 [Rhizodiscina lignyota]|uniref:Uncharacterized protein n=1 Tax=Rhizodiscina lignyota TaxID=1504668 RepID=A0A9P4MA22_9PEZI|nr:hypothetical protein NA57DRAFT_52784 [Rhizodiscina lignyota]
MYFSSVIALSLASGFATAICGLEPFQFGITVQVSDPNGLPEWFVFTQDCEEHESYNSQGGFTGNPCDSGFFTCTPEPITFDGYLEPYNNKWLSCYPDPDTDVCGGHQISVCCH